MASHPLVFLLLAASLIGIGIERAAGQEFDIRSEDGSVIIIPADQLRSYDPDSHVLTLAPNGRAELLSRLPKNRLVSGIRFSACVDGQVVYKGTFTTTLSSRSFSTLVIVVDAPSVNPDVAEDQLSIQAGYPSVDFFQGEDARSDPRIQGALEAVRPTTATRSGHTEWVIASLREMLIIKPGMTREQLLRVFREEGGLSTRTTQRFAFRDCPYFKVQVTFEPVGTEASRYPYPPQDKIVKVSQPFLEWSIRD